MAWNAGSAPTAGAKMGGDASAAGAANTVPGAVGVGVNGFNTGDTGYDMDADDLPSSGGSADGHADCVPSGGKWPANA